MKLGPQCVTAREWFGSQDPARATVIHMKPEDQTSKTGAHLGRSEILGIAGNIEDAKIAAIERSGATIEQLEEAVSWASGLSGVMSKERHPLSGVVAELYEILTADEVFGDERDLVAVCESRCLHLRRKHAKQDLP